jgi:hypothetical protein
MSAALQAAEKPTISVIPSEARNLLFFVLGFGSCARWRERDTWSFLNARCNHFQIPHHPVNDDPRNNIKAAHPHQHWDVTDMWDHSPGNNSGK